MAEMKVVLATVLRVRVLRLLDSRPVRASLRNTTASPARKIAMTEAVRETAGPARAASG
jgi:hypothetical protein